MDLLIAVDARAHLGDAAVRAVVVAHAQRRTEAAVDSPLAPALESPAHRAFNLWTGTTMASRRSTLANANAIVHIFACSIGTSLRDAITSASLPCPSCGDLDHLAFYVSRCFGRMR